MLTAFQEYFASGGKEVIPNMDKYKRPKHASD